VRPYDALVVAGKLKAPPVILAWILVRHFDAFQMNRLSREPRHTPAFTASIVDWPLDRGLTLWICKSSQTALGREHDGVAAIFVWTPKQINALEHGGRNYTDFFIFLLAEFRFRRGASGE
jgi:hypothetical protein